jgi:hypothetical protein
MMSYIVFIFPMFHYFVLTYVSSNEILFKILFIVALFACFCYFYPLELILKTSSIVCTSSTTTLSPTQAKICSPWWSLQVFNNSTSNGWWSVLQIAIVIGQIIILLVILNKLVPMTKHFIMSLHVWSEVILNKEKKCLEFFLGRKQNKNHDVNDFMWHDMTWMMSLDVICIMNDAMQREGVTSSCVKIFFGGIFWGIHHDHIRCWFNIIFVPLGSWKEGLCLCKFVEVLETKKLEAKG